MLFKNVYQFMQLKKLARNNKPEMMEIVAQGLVDGKVVTTAIKTPSRRPVKINLMADMDGLQPIADGSSIIPIIAWITDESGAIKRLNEENIKFTISGEGELIGNAENGANPRKIDWGTAPALIRASNTVGKITIVASPVFQGANSVEPITLVLETKPSPHLSIAEKDKIGKLHNKDTNVITNKIDSKLLKQKLKEVELDQETFENKGKRKNQ
jgi:beta-galactosidase